MLLLRAFLVVRADHVPSIYGVLTAVAAFGYIGYVLGLYVAPDADLRVLAVAIVGEPIFMIWLLVKGRRL